MKLSVYPMEKRHIRGSLIRFEKGDHIFRESGTLDKRGEGFEIHYILFARSMYAD